MSAEYLSVDVAMERIPLANRWATEKWQPASVVPAVGSGGPPVLEADGPAGTRWRFSGVAIELHPSEAEGYFLNLTSDTPAVFVMWRTAEDGVEPAARPEVVTLSYNQAGRMMDGGERVDLVPMDATIRARLEAYVAVHYKPEPKRKMKRNDPFADGPFVRDRDRAGRG
jgi:hypothetical protein